MFAVLPCPAFSAEGVLLTVKGKVAVFSHGASQPAKVGLRVKPADNIRSLGGDVSGLLSDGRMFRVGQDEEYKVPLDKTYGPAGTLASRLMSTIRETLSRGKGPRPEGLEKGKKEILPIYPHNATILSQDLRFEWERIEGVDQVEITVKCPWPIYTHRFLAASGETGAFLPRDASELVPGVRYYWKIKGIQNPGVEPYASGLVWFSILKPDDEREMENQMGAIESMELLDEEDRNILKAALMISYGLYHSASGILEKSLGKYPEDQGMRELLTGLYMKMKNPLEAEKIMKSGT
jgi:hypothetical protein